MTGSFFSLAINVRLANQNKKSGKNSPENLTFGMLLHPKHTISFTDTIK